MDKHALRERYDAQYAGDYMDADAYAIWVHEGLAAHRVRTTLQQVLGVPVQVLDYGCGQGKWITLLRSLYPEAKIHGIDVSAVAVDKAQRKHPDCEFAAFDGERAPFAEGVFDLVFSFHVLEHVLDIEASIRDIARLVRRGGQACIVFPCGNTGSFEDRFVRQFKNGRQPSPTGEPIFFFERAEGHLRRMESSKAIALFAAQGMSLQREFYSGQYFAALDWLIRGTGPHYLNGLFRDVTPRSRYMAAKLAVTRRVLLGLNRLIGFKHIDLARKRTLVKRVAARLVRALARVIDGGLKRLALREWERRRTDKAGSVQYLVFSKEG
jgi:SAM-dependent methyltransferase